jgi:hypothetical protein
MLKYNIEIKEFKICFPCCLHAADKSANSCVMVFCCVTPCNVMYVGISILKEHTAFIIRVHVGFPEDGRIIFLQNAGTHLPYYMVSQPRIPHYESLWL